MSSSFQSKFKEFLIKDYSLSLDNDSDEEMDQNEGIDYSKRCSKLLKRCETIKCENERLINSIYNIKKLTKKLEKHKKILIKRLTKKRIDFLNYDLPLFPEIEKSSQMTSNDIKVKNSVIRGNPSATNAAKSKKSKPNNNRNEMTSNSCAPKKPINPYLLFCQENRSSLQERYQSKHNTEMTHQELTKALAQQWHELSLTAKQVYYNLFTNEKVRYENEMKIFTANANKESNNESND